MKDLRDRRWQLAVNDRQVSVYQTRKQWASWIPALVVLFFAVNTYREVATTDNIDNTILASMIWGVFLLFPALVVFWLWGYNRRRHIVRFMNRKDTSDGVSVTLRDSHAGRHDFVVEPDEADRIERVVAASQA